MAPLSAAPLAPRFQRLVQLGFYLSAEMRPRASTDVRSTPARTDWLRPLLSSKMAVFTLGGTYTSLYLHEDG